MKIKGLKNLPREDHIIAKRAITGSPVTITSVPNQPSRFITGSSRVILNYTSLANIADLVSMDGESIMNDVIRAAF